MNEAETRAEHIDPALKAAGWGVVEGSRILREHGITLGRLQGGGQRAKAEIADYVLVYRNTKLAVVEAKAWGKPHTEGVAQAKSYAAKLAVRRAFATNGQAIYGIDMASGAEGDAAGYPGPDELWKLTFAEADAATAAWRDRFAAVPFADKGGSWSLRSYQEIAAQRVLARVADGADRILLTLATGTGKTSITFQIAWKLFKARWSLARDGARQPRILFLADRNNLATQAFNDFNRFAAFEERALVRIEAESIGRSGAVPRNGAVFFTIFQTFMSGPGGSPYFGEYPADFFDFIAEAARSASAADRACKLGDKQLAFVDFVLAQYVAQGVDELDAEKLSPLLKLKYNNAIADAFAELGTPDQVRRVFVEFQKHLYPTGPIPVGVRGHPSTAS